MTIPIIAIGGSLWQIISNTSTFGMIILIVLTVMSIVSWVIIFHKWKQFKEVEKHNERFIAHFNQTDNISESVGQAKIAKSSPFSNLYLSGLSELHALKEQQGIALESKIKLDEDDIDIIEMAMERALSEEMSVLDQKTIFLASTGNSAPFLGLLGTVVGIMDSFWAIGERGSASLAVVAPGIAEALLATIVGLATAIPAVIAFNWAKNKIKFINEFANNFVLEFITQAKKETL